jgi:hypothetical protein
LGVAGGRSTVAEVTQLTEAFAAVPWFANLRPRTQQALCSQLTLERAEPGARLFTQVRADADACAIAHAHAHHSDSNSCQL